MENTEKHNFTAGCTPEEPEKDICVLIPSESEFFRQMEKSLKKYAADMNAPDPLETLRDNIHHLNHLFVHLGRPWVADSGMIQKACMWYLANAAPSREEALKLARTLNGFTASACYLSEWHMLINRMQVFLATQEKELKRLLEYEKQTARSRSEEEERLRAEGVAYSMTIGGEKIYGMLYPQMEELYRMMGRFIEREKAPAESRAEGYDEYSITINKNISLCADGEEFHVSYDLSNFEFSLCSISAAQMQKVADTIEDFLRLSEEQAGKKACRDVKAGSRHGIAIEIKEDSRMPDFRTVPWVGKRICKDEDKEAETGYFIDVNEIHSPELSFSEFMAVYRELGDFLGSRAER